MLATIVIERFPIEFMGFWLIGVFLIIPCIQIFLFIKDWKEKKEKRNLAILMLSVLIIGAGIFRIAAFMFEHYTVSYHQFDGELPITLPTKAYLWSIIGHSTILALIGPLLIIIQSISNRVAGADNRPSPHTTGHTGPYHGGSNE